MFRRKITRKLTFIAALFLVLLICSMIMIQFMVVSRSYTVTEYTRERIDFLIEGSGFFVDNRLSVWWENIEAGRKVLNNYAKENSTYCLILDEKFEIAAQSDNISELQPSYLDYIKKVAEDGNHTLDIGRFRIQNSLHLPSKYVGFYKTIFSPNQQVDTLEVNYFVVITEEVYTSGQMKLFWQYGISLFLIAVFVSVVLAAFFSSLVTRPVLKLRDTAMQMAELDFSKKCSYRGKDELGDLAESLNFLSGKIDSTMGQLREANEKLKDDLTVQQKIDRMRKDFIASVSHEFKTPLTLIRGYLEMMEEQRLPEHERQNAQTVMIGEIDRLNKMVQNLLELSRLESEDYCLDTSCFDLVWLLEETVKKARPMFLESQVQFSMELPPNPVMTEADRDRIGQVVLNFLSNAARYTPEGGRAAMFCTVEMDCVWVTVRSDGVFIEEDHLRHMWEPYYRIEKSRARKSGGTGLGLSICREILEKHGSVYGAENRKEGICFFFALKISSD